jgi:hypothetical protein
MIASPGMATVEHGEAPRVDHSSVMPVTSAIARVAPTTRSATWRIEVGLPTNSIRRRPHDGTPSSPRSASRERPAPTERWSAVGAILCGYCTRVALTSAPVTVLERLRETIHQLIVRNPDSDLAEILAAVPLS